MEKYYSVVLALTWKNKTFCPLTFQVLLLVTVCKVQYIKDIKFVKKIAGTV